MYLIYIYKLVENIILFYIILCYDAVEKVSILAISNMNFDSEYTEEEIDRFIKVCMIDMNWSTKAQTFTELLVMLVCGVPDEIPEQLKKSLYRVSQIAVQHLSEQLSIEKASICKQIATGITEGKIKGCYQA
jgi:hypothetical protein